MTRIMQRSDWGAAPAKRITRWSPGHPTAIRVHHGGAWYDAHDSAGRERDPGAIVRAVQVHSFGLGHSDVMYNAFVVPYFNESGEPDALIACGRGFEFTGSANGTSALNATNLAINVIGNYVTDAEWYRMSVEQRRATGGTRPNSFTDNPRLAVVLAEAIDLAIYANPSVQYIGPHRDIRATVCPGGQIVEAGRATLLNVRGRRWVDGGVTYG